MVQAGFLDSVLNPVFLPLLKLGPFFAIFIISLFLTFLTTIIYKYVTNQKLMKTLRDDLKGLQKDMKGLKDNPSKMMGKQKELMTKNMEYMKHSMWSTIFTIFPVLIVFGWLNANLAFAPLIADQGFNITVTMGPGFTAPPQVELPSGIEVSNGYPKGLGSLVVFNFKGKEGVYDTPPIRFKYEGETCDVPVKITAPKGNGYYYPTVACKTQHMQSALVSNRPMRTLGEVSIFGWHPGWFGTYIILSLIFSMLLRKVLKVY